MEFIKQGAFEWIIGFEDIKKYFRKDYTGITEANETLRVLEIGCGTSTLSVQLRSELNYGEVVSIDNDADCIEHMKRQYNNRKELSWFVYDMIEDRNKKQNNCLDNDQYFNIIVDKGTFDAIHVEGSISPLLEEVYRLLAVNGVYILCSISSQDYLQPLLSIPELSFDVQVYELQLSQFKVATVLICKKMLHKIIDSSLLQEEERFISDAYFKNQKPLLTPEFEDFIRKGFLTQASTTNGLLSINQAHILMFESEHFSGDDAFLSYTLELFKEDLEEFSLLVEGFMNVEEALEFIKTMQ